MIPRILILFVFLFLYSFSFTSADISLGSTLFASNPNQTWPSPSSTFSLHFLPINSSAYTLAVTYDSIPIWTAATGGASIITGADATFRLLPDGNLRLLTGSGAFIWQSNTSGRGVTHADLDDSGNFMLKNGSDTVWSTFDNPTDTVVPSQNFTVNDVLSSGLYSFSLNRTGNLTLRWNNDVVFWSSGLNASVEANLSNPQLGLQSIGILSLYDASIPSGSVVVAYSSDYAESGNILRFLKLDSDGNLRIYSSVRGSGTTTVRWTAVSDQCLVFGYCGNMGICSYNDTSPVCGCPSENFDPVDPNGSRKGCKLKKEIKDCQGSATMLQMDHTRFLTYPPENVNDVYFVGISACRGNCLSGSSCVASTTLADGSGQCYIKTSNFVSGYQSPTLPSTSYVKVCGPVVPNPPPPAQEAGRGGKLRGWVIVVVILGTLLGLALLEGSLWWCCCRKSPNFGGLSAQYALLEYASDRKLARTQVDMDQVTRAIKVSFWCIQEQPSQRPMMGKVVQMLEGIMEIEKPPAPKTAPEGSISGNSLNISSSISALSTFAASGPAPSASSSFQTPRAPSSLSGMNVERHGSSLTQRETIHTFSLLYLSLLLHLLTWSSFAAEIPLGSSLSSSNPDQTWSSPAKTFSLRFLPINSSTFSLAITHGSIPIWTGGAVVGGGASFRLLPSGDLRLLSASGAVVWSSGTANRGVSHATLDDSGNFILKNGSVSIWSSFDHPTDTIVPSLNFTAKMILESGSYSFSLMKTGNLTLMWNNSVVYYSSGLNSSVSANLSNPYLSLQSTGVLNLYDPMLPKPVIIAYSGDYGDSGDIFRFLKLDGDGNLRIYSSSMGGNTVTVRWAAVSDQCMVFGYCGNMGICRYNDSSPICGCPSQNFEPIDPSDSRKGCKLKKDLKDCPQSQAMLQLDHTSFLTHPPETNSELFFEGISACSGNCLSGPCLTSTSLGDGSGQCYQTSRSDFISGYQFAALPSTSFVKVCKPVLPNPASSSEELRKDDKKLDGWTISLAILGTLLSFILVEGSLWWWCCRKSPNFGGMSMQYTLLEYASESIVDKRLGDYEVDMDQVTRAIQVSFWCIQEQPSQRPTMGKVVQMLEGVLEIEEPPAPKTAPEVGPSSFDMGVFSTLGASSSGPDTFSSISTQTSRHLSSGLRGNEETPALSLV
ncbi:hypothetical protein Cgig2_029527 [Carnegiea gigantea]|uniref:non-specific serine/threonine protein kinase n=1 Tax=Carnegiea gigantea TaxID=171969 RepID=A0A9Q1QM50_9CARY|nr:hypothetical protein Cgig2_029527 [Carnegiea gigantea]